MRTSIFEKFHAKCTRSPTTGCWNWSGALWGNGYGQLRIDGKNTSAHRLSWELYRGPLDKDLLICHDCDNPACVNPWHLFVGTHKENTQDALRKGRMKPYKGPKPANAKLSSDAVREIRRLHKEEGKDTAMLGRMFGVDQKTAWKIVNNRTWKHI